MGNKIQVCPKCGYQEPLIWKNRQWQLFQQYTRIEELESFEETKELAAILRRIQPLLKGFNKVSYSDGFYNYQYKADGFVIRIPKVLARSPNGMREPEKEKGNLGKPKKLKDNSLVSSLVQTGALKFGEFVLKKDSREENV